MKKTLLYILFILFSSHLISSNKIDVELGADQLDLYLPLLKNKRVALVINQTSVLSNNTHLIDTLLMSGVKVVKIFAPEHGFRGNADAGENIRDGKDSITGLPIISLYGRNKKPNAEMLSDIDIVIFDIQDVGARFYTYISTMYYVMDACAKNDKEMLILDRPNPHDYIDGPVLDLKYRSFVGALPIPVLHGTTVGELALMINGEGWLTNSQKSNLMVIPLKGWKHGDAYSLPIKPSPNLPNDQSIRLYASLCFFEATDISVGRGTYYPFQVIGYPNPLYGDFTFKPQSLPGFDKNPLHKNKLCYGVDLRYDQNLSKGLSLQYLISFYKKSNIGSRFFKSPKFMNLLAGNDILQNQILNGMSEDEIRKTWKDQLDIYVRKRQKYLLYPDKIY